MCLTWFSVERQDDCWITKEKSAWKWHFWTDLVTAVTFGWSD